MSKLISFFLVLMNLVGCSKIACNQLNAGNVDIDEYGVGFRIIKNDGGYWGELNIYTYDKTISYSSNSGKKFRDDFSDLEFVRYSGDGETGIVELKWNNRKSIFCVAGIEKDKWEQVKAHVESSIDSDKFKTIILE